MRQCSHLVVRTAGGRVRAALAAVVPAVLIFIAARSAVQASLLRRWVAEGARYGAEPMTPTAPSRKSHWSMQPVRKPAVPITQYDRFARTPVDRFLYAKLIEKGLWPSRQADLRTQIRRLTYDLTGLPPTPEEIAAFLADRAPNAYEKVVDRLLASPAYGERWGRHWLDVVRYGDSHGYEQNHIRANAWPYRDYVIRAFNDDRPFPDFIAEQLAGDVVAGNAPDRAAATGFLVAGVHDTVGNQTEQGRRQQRADDLDDMVATTGAAFLGLTVGCCRCHDHKFDPIPQIDYYRLTAVFAGVRHGERALTEPDPGALRAAEQIDRKITEANEALNALDRAAREKILRRGGVPAGARPAVNARRNVDDFPPVMARYVRFTVLQTRDNAEPCLDELQVYGSDPQRNLALASRGARASASSLLPGFAIHQIAHLNDGKFGNDFSWISASRGSGWAQIELPEPATVQRVVWSRDGSEIPRFDDRLPIVYRIELSLDGSRWRTVSTAAGRAGSSDYIHPDALREAMTPEERTRRKELARELAVLREEAKRLRNAALAYVGQFGAPDPIHILRRGDVMQPGDEVPPGALSQLTGLGPELRVKPGAAEPERRLALARWIADDRNPLTPRVLVNRVWQHHFGRGLVGTPSDFGANGEKPTHPELLDWLACDFREHGWRLKHLHKMLVLSAAYRQVSDIDPKRSATDAGNLYLWRMPLRRLEAEAVRDTILAISGKLDRRMGGPGFPLFQYRVVNVAIYDSLEVQGPETWRRSVYRQIARGIHDDLLGKFDCPESSQRAPRRESTTTALQALTLLNGGFARQQAGYFAQRVRMEAGADPLRQAKQAFLLAFGRPARAEEAAAGARLIAESGVVVLCHALLNASELLYY